MFNRLRLRLTLIYMLATLALIALIGAGSYLILQRYFQTTTDLALEHKMVHEFYLLGAPIPRELAAADSDWSTLRAGLFERRPGGDDERYEERERGEYGGERDEEEYERYTDDDWAAAIAYSGELASIFVLPLDARGHLLFDPNPSAPPIAPDEAAVAAALARGHDWRTVTTTDDTQLRLLTYRLTRSDGPAVLQLGRALSDQQRVLDQLVLGLLLLSGVCALLVASGSWWLAGRALMPAQQAWERQQVFIANASHELRTPLTLIRASAEVAQRSLPPAEANQRELLGDILSESDHMRRLVEDLLLLSRIDAGQLQLKQTCIDAGALLQNIARQASRVAAERQISVCTEGTGWVLGDATRLHQVLLILLDNALRYTPVGGEVTLTAAAHGESVDIVVADSGSGIAAEHLPHLFERFYRVDSARSPGSGAGLGLAIARALTEAQQGRISAESQPGQGARFTLTLRRAQP